jgi:hypothetical protein
VARVAEVISDAGFDNPPTDDQMCHVNNWTENVRTRGDAIFVMDVPDDEQLRVEWADIWFVFTEFISVNRTRGDLMVAVIGYD